MVVELLKNGVRRGLVRGNEDLRVFILVQKVPAPAISSYHHFRVLCCAHPSSVIFFFLT